MLKPFKEAGAEAAQQNHDFWKPTCRSYEVSINMYAMKTSLLLKKIKILIVHDLSSLLTMQPMDAIFRFSFTQVSKSQKGR